MKKDDEAVQISRGWLKLILVILAPIIFILAAELALRVINYGRDLSLFIAHPEAPSLLYINPYVGERYYVSGRFLPETSADMFREKKTPDTYRLFVLGGSSAAGYPYLHNGAFSRMLRAMLEKSLPGKNIEIINVGMTAVNSFTLLDLMPEIIEQSPDGILIYAGHNEFYGALGAGSAQNIGNSPPLIRLYLFLVHSRLFQLLRNTFSLFVPSAGKQNETLMHRMAKKQAIAYGSDLYTRCKINFSGNLAKIFKLSNEHKIPVYIGNLVSNIKDQPPFISVDKGGKIIPAGKQEKAYSDIKNNLYNTSGFDSAAAVFHFIRGREYLRHGDSLKAKKELLLAKDLDALRFRATEEFNEIISAEAKKANAKIVDIKALFEKNSRSGIIGNELILEHLHPNLKGYYLIARAFYNSLVANGVIKNGKNFSEEEICRLTAIDSLAADYRLKILLNDWPFTGKKRAVKFNAESLEQKMAEKLVRQKISWEKAHFTIAKYYEKSKKENMAVKEYYALISETPYNFSPYRLLVSLLIRTKRFGEAKKSLRRAEVQGFSGKDALFVLTMLGNLYLREQNHKKSLVYYLKAYTYSPNDPKLLYNMTGAYILAGDKTNAQKYFNRYKKNSDNRQKTEYLGNLIRQMR